MSKKVRVLSIDGGGIRGIIPGVIVSYLEQELQKKEGADVRLSDYFDLLSGTSTGGILTCTYLVPDKDGRPKFTAQQAVDMYLNQGGDIFDVSTWRKIKTGDGLFDEKYSAAALEKALEEYFGETKLSELIKPCLITSYDIRSRKAMFFNMADANNDIYDFKVKDVARATSAAPTYFEPAHIKSLFGTQYPLVDGGMFANNPTMCAYSEARTMKFKEGKQLHPTAKDMMIISISTGAEAQPYPYSEMKDKGVLGWVKPIIDILMSGNSETVDYQLKQIFDAVDNTSDYYRLEPSLYNASKEMDNACEENLLALKEAGMQYVSQNSEMLDEIVNKLIAHKA